MFVWILAQQWKAGETNQLFLMGRDMIEKISYMIPDIIMNKGREGDSYTLKLFFFLLFDRKAVVEGPAVGKTRNCPDWIARGLEMNELEDFGNTCSL